MTSKEEDAVTVSLDHGTHEFDITRWVQRSKRLYADTGEPFHLSTILDQSDLDTIQQTIALAMALSLMTPPENPAHRSLSFIAGLLTSLYDQMSDGGKEHGTWEQMEKLLAGPAEGAQA
jgi:hypothetical protein